DALGHPAGDELLRTVATRLRSTTRASDTVARFGGDEFAIIASNLDEPSQVVPLAEKLIKVVNEPFTIAGRQIEVAVSLGIDFFSASAADAETLLRHADMALYRAKAKGRGSFQFFTRSMDRQVRNRMGLARELHEAVSGDQLFLLYQPQVELSTGTVTGVEALVRWRHPHRGVLRPARFIPVAEETGLIGRVGGWVATTALGHARRWPSDPRGARRLAINVSARQFTGHSTFDRELQRLLAGPDCGPLELEFTEAALFKISRDHADVLRTLRRLDVAIAIDDFGTGYSSLDHLRSLPVARIKLAQTYVRRIEESVGDASIVRATIGLARELGIRVIAEGVETAGQVELLRAWGCQEGQGYAFARPMAAGAVRALLAGGEALAPTNASSKRPATSSEAPLAPISR
ncbi:MAG: bifunctional diguanylate cyclase/phosphodiesterase, partial [Caulobacteraceae bacterium]|nr:bifunctional diguanylate cyclase/phosphodiesterase [Caulobacteraceae bacterium]